MLSPTYITWVLYDASAFCLGGATIATRLLCMAISWGLSMKRALFDKLRRVARRATRRCLKPCIGSLQSRPRVPLHRWWSGLLPKHTRTARDVDALVVSLVYVTSSQTNDVCNVDTNPGAVSFGRVPPFFYPPPPFFSACGTRLCTLLTIAVALMVTISPPCTEPKVNVTEVQRPQRTRLALGSYCFEY